jgi:hypothetical protein
MGLAGDGRPHPGRRRAVEQAWVSTRLCHFFSFSIHVNYVFYQQKLPKKTFDSGR